MPTFEHCWAASVWKTGRKRRQLGCVVGTQRPRVTVIDQLSGAVREGFLEEVRLES